MRLAPPSFNQFSLRFNQLSLFVKREEETEKDSTFLHYFHSVPTLLFLSDHENSAKVGECREWNGAFPCVIHHNSGRTPLVWKSAKVGGVWSGKFCLSTRLEFMHVVLVGMFVRLEWVVHCCRVFQDEFSFSRTRPFSLFQVPLALYASRMSSQTKGKSKERERELGVLVGQKNGI